MKLVFDNDPADTVRVCSHTHAAEIVRIPGAWDSSLVLLDDEGKPIRRWIKSIYEGALETNVDSTPEQDQEILRKAGPTPLDYEGEILTDLF